jgi:hypothetical protein
MFQLAQKVSGSYLLGNVPQLTYVHFKCLSTILDADYFKYSNLGSLGLPLLDVIFSARTLNYV